MPPSLEEVQSGGVAYRAKHCFHARQAAAALLKMAKTTSDPRIAARLVEAAAALKDQAGELPISVSSKAPDVQTDR